MPYHSPPDMIYRIVYSSAAVPVHDPQGFYKDIAQTAEAYNKAQGITGILLLHQDLIIQFLEGPINPVKALYSRIYRDERHMAPVLMAEGGRMERQFPDQPMGFDTITMANLSAYNFALEALELSRLADAQNRLLTQTLLQSFYRVNHHAQQAPKAAG